MSDVGVRSTPHSLRPWLAALAVALVAGVVALLVLRSGAYRPEPVGVAKAMGDSTCLSCHANKSSFEGTAHRLTSRHPTREAIAGSFAPGRNLLRTHSASLYFRMDSTPAGFFQTAITRTGSDTTTRTERIAYVTGSGRKGQSFLYWTGDRLFQLPVSYWRSLDSWINSPGAAYQDGTANFGRAISPRCLECHATYMEPVPELVGANRFDSTTAVLGITCEKCHAAGQQHVANQRSALRVAKPRAIVNPAKLDRTQQIEACAQCHGGLGKPITPSFAYVAGQPLGRYLELPPLPPDAKVDVHGNQVALLARSRCFTESQMTCSSCHDVHRPQRDVKELSGRCLTCHQPQSHKPVPAQSQPLVGRCVDCHMPLQTSSTLVSNVLGKPETVQVRTHWIKVYPDSATR
jgi:nitrate/TMAO reductase-like tetraheme cytochrome c subunit